MDSEFLAISVVFVLIGVAGVVLFYGPMNKQGDSCYCIIPSPEPGAAQGTASIFLALGLAFLPMGLMKGGLPSFRRAPVPTGGGPAPPVASGRLFGTGILLLAIGIDAAVIPGYLVFRSLPITAAGAIVAAIGAYALYEGYKKPKSA